MTTVLELVDAALREHAPAALEVCGLLDQATKLRALPELTPSNAGYASDIVHVAFTVARRNAHNAAKTGDDDFKVKEAMIACHRFALAACACHAAADACAAIHTSRKMPSPGLYLSAAKTCALEAEGHAREVCVTKTKVCP